MATVWWQWLLMITLFICGIHGACHDDLRGKKYWIWAKKAGEGKAGRVHERFNKYFVPADYVGSGSDTKHRFTYTKGTRTVYFEFDFDGTNTNNNCDLLANAIQSHNGKPVNIIKLGDTYTVTMDYYKDGTSSHLTEDDGRIYVRPIHDDDKPILWVGKKYAYLHLVIFRNIDLYLPYHLSDFQELLAPQFVFTTIKPNDTTVTTLQQRQQILNHQGIVLFGYGSQGTSTGLEWVKHPDFVKVHIQNFARQFVDGKTEPLTTDEQKQKVIDGTRSPLNNKVINGENHSIELIRDCYEYVGDYNPSDIERRWDRIGDRVNASCIDKPPRKYVHFRDNRSNNLFVFGSSHKSLCIKKMLKDELLSQSARGEPYDIIITEIDWDRLHNNPARTDRIWANPLNVDDMQTVISTTVSLQNDAYHPKIVLADFPRTQLWYNLSFLLTKPNPYINIFNGDDYQPVVIRKYAFNAWMVIRNHVMVNTVNAVVKKLNLRNKRILWIIGNTHNAVELPSDNPLRNDPILSKYAITNLLTTNTKIASYVRNTDGSRLKWRFNVTQDTDWTASYHAFIQYINNMDIRDMVMIGLIILLCFISICICCIFGLGFVGLFAFCWYYQHNKAKSDQQYIDIESV